MLTGAWHDLGAETRPFAYTAFGLYVQDEPVAVATAGTTVSASGDLNPHAIRFTAARLLSEHAWPADRQPSLLSA